MSFENLEDEVMRHLLRGDDPVLAALRGQFRATVHRSRELTGAGFFTTFEIPNDAPRIQGEKSFTFGDVEATFKRLLHGAGFLLHVEKGALHMLEGYSYDEPWPLDIQEFRVSYIGSNRDLISLREAWTK